MIRRPPRSTLSSSSAASDVYKRMGLSFLRVGKLVLLAKPLTLKLTEPVMKLLMLPESRFIPDLYFRIPVLVWLRSEAEWKLQLITGRSETLIRTSGLLLRTILIHM